MEVSCKRSIFWMGMLLEFFLFKNEQALISTWDATTSSPIDPNHYYKLKMEHVKDHKKNDYDRFYV